MIQKKKILPPIYVSALYIYPLKGARPIEMGQLELGEFGFKYDRHWMIINNETLRAVTQRQSSKLTLIIPKLTKNELILEAPDMENLVISLNSSMPKNDITVGVWDDYIVAWDEGPKANAWISKFLGYQCRIVRMKINHDRKILKHTATGCKNQCSFADGYPFLIVNTVSMDDLNKRLIENSSRILPITRFRPNIVLSGNLKPWEEDFWIKVKIGSTIFHVVKPCDRCRVPTIDQFTGEQGEEPAKTLRTFRQNSDKAIFFGQNLIHDQYKGKIKVGEEAIIISDTVPHPLVKDLYDMKSL